MVENTPSYAFAAGLLAQPRNAIYFAGYCDPETPGGKLLATKPGEKFTFNALPYVAPVKARVERFDLSAHAEREELLAYAQAATRAPSSSPMATRRRAPGLPGNWPAGRTRRA